MLLRRITTHVKEQNWAAIGIDFVIVVVGVFIGIQVSNWNETRMEAEKSATYIERLREDLDENVKDFSDRKAYFSQVRKHALAALEALEASKTDLNEQFIVDIYQASQYMPRELGRDTYNEILSVGALNSDSEQAIRKRLSNFYRSITAQQVNVNADVPYRDLIRGIIPYEVQSTIRGLCREVDTVDEMGEPRLALPTTCSLNLTETQIADAIMAIKKADVKIALIHRLSQLDIMLRGINQVIERAMLLDDYLDNVK